MTKIIVGPVEISAAHIVHLAEESSKCQRMHGHNYIISAELDGPIQDDGMVVDAHHIKDIIDGLDHKTLITKNMCPHVVENNFEFENPTNGMKYSLPTYDCKVLDIPATTAEYLSQWIVTRILIENPHLNSISVRVWETQKLGALSEFVKELPQKDMITHFRSNYVRSGNIRNI